MLLSLRRQEKSGLQELSNLLTPFQIRLVRALSEEKASFILIGGHAALVYGSSRTTGDMDLLVRPDRENGVKVIHAFVALGLDCGNLIPEDFEENLVLTFGLEPDAVDIINRLKGSHFEEVWANAKVLEVITGLPIPVLDARDLLREKRLLKREGIKGLSDQMDILSLEAFLKEKD
jgi:hypothetical protein